MRSIISLYASSVKTKSNYSIKLVPQACVCSEKYQVEHCTITNEQTVQLLNSMLARY